MYQTLTWGVITIPQPSWHHFKVFLFDFPRLFSNLPSAKVAR